MSFPFSAEFLATERHREMLAAAAAARQVAAARRQRGGRRRRGALPASNHGTATVTTTHR